MAPIYIAYLHCERAFLLLLCIPPFLAASPRCSCPSSGPSNVLDGCLGPLWLWWLGHLTAGCSELANCCLFWRGEGSMPQFPPARGLPGCEVGGGGLCAAKKKERKWHKDLNVAKSALREIRSRQRREKINA